jgi:hypothetical protein
MYKNPLSYLQKWIGGNIHWCPFCRLQFYDIRKKAPTVRRGPPLKEEHSGDSKTVDKVK